jgi:putative phosphoesterase
MTRIGLISDIHVDLNAEDGADRVTEALAAESRRRGLDILLIAGDLSGDYRLSLAAVDRLAVESGVQVHFVPGNHDIWNEKYPGLKALDTYGALLDHPANLARGPVFIDDGWTLIGDLGWYDFSFGDLSFTAEDFQRMSYMGRSWRDKVYSLWDKKTVDVHRMFLDRIRQALDLAAGGKVLLATHVVQIGEFIVQNPGDMWKYFNAFLGSPDYGELAVERGVALSVCGHVHYRRRVKKGGTEFVCPCLGYRAEWEARDGKPADTAREVAEALSVWDLGKDGPRFVEE